MTTKLPDHRYRILIIWGSESGKSNESFNLISQQPDIDKIYLYAKDPCEAKYQLLINKRESTDLKYCEDSEAFIEYSNNMNDVYKNLEELQSPNQKQKILTVCVDMIADMLCNKKLNPILIELFIRSIKSRKKDQEKK